MLSLVKIDGTSFDALVTAIQETTEVLEGKNSGTSLYREREIRDITGVKIGHTVTFAPDNDPDAFDALYNHLFSTIREYVTVEIVHGQETIAYKAAYNTAARNVSHIDDENGVVYWDELTVAFRPLEAQVYADSLVNDLELPIVEMENAAGGTTVIIG